ncbi:MAG TPA: hypothetical protein VF166_07410 [Gemmatimonadaceae bacterium]
MDRHLLPDEIDQLLDGEVGFGTAPLKAHIRQCAECRSELEEAAALVRTIERLPHYAPSPLFTDRVMSQVQVFVPWHATLLDSVRRWAPRSRGARAVGVAVAGGAAAVLTVVTLFLITRLDAVMFAVGLITNRVRTAVFAFTGDAITTIFGEPAMHVLRASGALGIGVALLAILLAAAIALRMLRALTTSPTRR